MSDPVQSTSEEPRWTRPDFREYYAEKCVVEEREGRAWHLGKGVGPAAHPLAHAIPMSEYDCAACGGIYPYHTVVAATHTPGQGYASGPFSYEFQCDSCGRYNQVVKAE